MADITLGLDVGCASVGWALVDEASQTIVGSGVRVFPEGVDRDTSGAEKSKNQARRDARGMRRQIARRARRRRLLRRWLAEVELFPAEPAVVDELLRSSPYQLRRRALDEPLVPHELGRVFLHLAQRRGFLSNRKTDRGERDKETQGMLAQISALDAAIHDAPARTLGEYLAQHEDQMNHTLVDNPGKLRGRHTHRRMLEQEFDAIWESQRRFHPELLTEKLKYGTAGRQSYPKKPEPLGKSSTLLDRYGIHGLIFFQRRMYWPKSVVGRCELERGERRCERADRAAQRFRLLQEVNHLRLSDPVLRQSRPLTDVERANLIQYLSSAKQRKFDEIRKKLDLPESAKFNFEQGGRDKLQGNITDYLLAQKKALGAKWNQLAEEVKNLIVRILISEDQPSEAVERLSTECGLSEDEAQRAASVHLPEGYLSFSRVAIQNLLPHLERGLTLMADDATNSALHAAGYLRPDQREINQQSSLPAPPDLPNPIVRQALFEVRRLVNSIIREYGLPARIHVELAREAKKSAEQRDEMRRENAKRNRAREAARDWIEEHAPGVLPSRANVNRYLLWQEQEQSCIYCGQAISHAQLFGGEIDIDHILPRWQSLDDSLANKVVCHRVCNMAKGQQTPRQWLEATAPEQYEQVLQASRKLPFGKQRRFLVETVELDDFINRQLTDTAYISRSVTQYLRCLGVPVVCPRGAMTAELRHHWGLNTILDPDGRGEKNRADHRHHAVDALVLALTNPARLHALANDRGKNVRLPWATFHDDARQSVLAINVSHRVLRKVRGALHEQTFYGATQKKPLDEQPVTERPWTKHWIEDPEEYVYRVPLDRLTPSQIGDIRDQRIRELVLERLHRFGIEPGHGQDKIPKDVWKEPLFVTSRRNAKNGVASGSPIRTVRIIKRDRTIRPLPSGQAYVKPGSTHHIVIFERIDAKGRRRRELVSVTMLEAARRARSGEPLIQRTHPSDPQAQFIMSLSQGEMVEADIRGTRGLFVYVTSVSTEGKVRLAHHTDARPSAARQLFNVTANTLQGQKVTVDPLGRIRRARD